jgi:F-type H+-transporting ATPase subunit gamma
MKMVSAAKLRRAQENIIQMRPYAKKLSEMLATVSAGAETAAESTFKQTRATVERALIIVVTSDRGLCGAFNANVIKAANALIQDKYAQQASKGNVEILALGKKGAEAFARKGFKVNTDYISVYQQLNFGFVKKAAESIMADFESGKYDAVELVFNEFKNVATQLINANAYLPIVSDPDAVKAVSSSAANYSFEPSEASIINDLIPKSLKIQLYRSVLESNASEHGARMTAMDKATENANDLIKALRLEYNRSRQAAITTEILEIVGGAEALAQA